MRATVIHGPRDIRVEDRPDPRIEAPTDAIVRIRAAAICGSDLWPYRGVTQPTPGAQIGHEFMGIVEEVGSEVTSVRTGDMVLAPFVFSCGQCEYCLAGLQTSCRNGGFWGSQVDSAGQAEAARVPLADGTLVGVPQEAAEDDKLLAAMLPVTDVLVTGHHAAVAAGVGPGRSVAVVGDGAVGLCGILAAVRLGAEQVIALGHHEDRLAIARQFGATDIVTTRGEDAVKEVRRLTKGGAHSVLECVGVQSSMDTALAICRDGGRVGYVGVPNEVQGVDLRTIFRRNITIAGGIAPARAYMPELLADVVAGTIDPSPIFTLQVDLEGVPDGYAAMDSRHAIKVLVRP